MALTIKHVPILLLFLPILASCLEKQVYIVRLGEHKGDKTVEEIEEKHHSYLLSVKGTVEDAKSSMLYSYKHVVNGFAALLTPDEASKLSEMEEVASVSQSDPNKYTLMTTRSWQFSGLQKVHRLSLKLDKENVWLKSRYGKDIIVGMIDSGVWPESESFTDEGMGPIPKHWKGICQTGDNFTSSHCNKKLIGARYYIKAYEAYYGPLNRTLDSLSPRDLDGHGTHTASILGGRRVHDASALGFARGTASGGAPLARLAIYKVCWAFPKREKVDGNTCFEEDMLAGMDDAIADGVHIMSVSIGTQEPIPYDQDGIAIAALHAVKKNIVVACAAGNSGPQASTLSNVAPWIITVGATSLDRDFYGHLMLGDGEKITGQTVTPHNLPKKMMYPLVYAAQVVSPHVRQNETGQCLPGSLSREKTKGKIVFCLRGTGTRIGKGMEVKRAGGIGFILGNNEFYGDDIPIDPHYLPATTVAYHGSLKILNYINSTKAPKAYIFPAVTELHTKPAPYTADFTSRGPSILSPDILKPDIAAPGLNILAAWSEADSPTKLSIDNRRVKYNLLSGTSMACPHVGATSALLRAIHPNWSGAAIRSAIITSAGLNNKEGKFITDAFGNPADPFQFGSGFFRPTKAVDPGLVYDASYTDYLLFLCASGLDPIDPSFTCPKNAPSPANLNYPSLAIPKLNGTVSVTRTVTNVGGPGKSVYFASAKPPPGISMKILPSILYFDHIGQKKSFTITVEVDKETETPVEKNKYMFGWFSWNDGLHNVRSPMAVSVA